MIASRSLAPRGLLPALLLSASLACGARSADAQAAQPPSPAPPDPHAGHVMPPSEPAPAEALPAFIRPLTDEDRAAAFPHLHDDRHPAHGSSINSFVLFEQLEWRNADRDTLAWDTKGWIGGDVDRVWVRTEGDAEDGGVQEAQVHALYGRAIGRWWDLVAGVRQDWRPGPSQTWAAIGVQGIAPYFFDVEATAYVGGGGRAHVRVETSYDLLLTNRLIAQPLFEFEVAGKADPARGVGAGLTVGEVSLRLRYEVRREWAPYVGLLWRRTFFGTADLARLAGRGVGGVSVAAGGRLFF